MPGASTKPVGALESHPRTHDCCPTPPLPAVAASLVSLRLSFPRCSVFSTQQPESHSSGSAEGATPAQAPPMASCLTRIQARVPAGPGGAGTTQSLTASLTSTLPTLPAAHLLQPHQPPALLPTTGRWLSPPPAGCPLDGCMTVPLTSSRPLSNCASR